MEKTIKDWRKNYSTKQKKKTTAQTGRDATVGNNTIAGSTLFETIVQYSNSATVSTNIVPVNILKKVLNASQPTFTKIVENDLKALCLNILQQKVTKGSEIALDLLLGRALLRAKDYKAKTTIDI